MRDRKQPNHFKVLVYNGTEFESQLLANQITNRFWLEGSILRYRHKPGCACSEVIEGQKDGRFAARDDVSYDVA